MKIPPMSYVIAQLSTVGAPSADQRQLQRSYDLPSAPGRGSTGKSVNVDPAGGGARGNVGTPSGGNYRMEGASGGSGRLFFMSLESVLANSIGDNGETTSASVTSFVDQLLRDRYADVTIHGANVSVRVKLKSDGSVTMTPDAPLANTAMNQEVRVGDLDRVLKQWRIDLHTPQVTEASRKTLSTWQSTGKLPPGPTENAQIKVNALRDAERAFEARPSGATRRALEEALTDAQTTLRDTGREFITSKIYQDFSSLETKTKAALQQPGIAAPVTPTTQTKPATPPDTTAANSRVLSWQDLTQAQDPAAAALRRALKRVAGDRPLQSELARIPPGQTQARPDIGQGVEVTGGSAASDDGKKGIAPTITVKLGPGQTASFTPLIVLQDQAGKQSAAGMVLPKSLLPAADPGLSALPPITPTKLPDIDRADIERRQKAATDAQVRQELEAHKEERRDQNTRSASAGNATIDNLTYNMSLDDLKALRESLRGAPGDKTSWNIYAHTRTADGKLVPGASNGNYRQYNHTTLGLITVGDAHKMADLLDPIIAHKEKQAARDAQAQQVTAKVVGEDANGMPSNRTQSLNEVPPGTWASTDHNWPTLPQTERGIVSPEADKFNERIEIDRLAQETGLSKREIEVKLARLRSKSPADAAEKITPKAAADSLLEARRIIAPTNGRPSGAGSVTSTGGAEGDLKPKDQLAKDAGALQQVIEKIEALSPEARKVKDSTEVLRQQLNAAQRDAIGSFKAYRREANQSAGGSRDAPDPLVEKTKQLLIRADALAAELGGLQDEAEQKIEPAITEWIAAHPDLLPNTPGQNLTPIEQFKQALQMANPRQLGQIFKALPSNIINSPWFVARVTHLVGQAKSETALDILDHLLPESLQYNAQVRNKFHERRPEVYYDQRAKEVWLEGVDLTNTVKAKPTVLRAIARVGKEAELSGVERQLPASLASDADVVAAIKQQRQNLRAQTTPDAVTRTTGFVHPWDSHLSHVLEAEQDYSLSRNPLRSKQNEILERFKTVPGESAEAHVRKGEQVRDLYKTLAGTGISPAEVMWVAEHAHRQPDIVAREMVRGDTDFSALPDDEESRHARTLGNDWQKFRQENPGKAQQLVDAMVGSKLDPKIVYHIARTLSVDPLQFAQAVGSFAPNRQDLEGKFGSGRFHSSEDKHVFTLNMEREAGKAGFSRAEILRICYATGLVPAEALAMAKHVKDAFPQLTGGRTEGSPPLTEGTHSFAAWPDVLATLDPSNNSYWNRQAVAFDVPWIRSTPESVRVVMFRDQNNELQGAQLPSARGQYMYKRDMVPLARDKQGDLVVNIGGKTTKVQELFERDGSTVYVFSKTSIGIDQLKHAESWNALAYLANSNSQDQFEVNAMDARGTPVRFKLDTARGKPRLTGTWGDKPFEVSYDINDKRQTSGRNVSNSDLEKLGAFLYSKLDSSAQRYRSGQPLSARELDFARKAPPVVGQLDLSTLVPGLVVRVTELPDGANSSVVLGGLRNGSIEAEFTVLAKRKNGKADEFLWNIRGSAISDGDSPDVTPLMFDVRSTYFDTKGNRLPLNREGSPLVDGSLFRGKQPMHEVPYDEIFLRVERLKIDGKEVGDP
jgi:hypothetical protein